MHVISYGSLEYIKVLSVERYPVDPIKLLRPETKIFPKFIEMMRRLNRIFNWTDFD